MLARTALSGICSIRPAPNTGVGIRKMTLLFCSSWLKFGCASVQPFAPSAGDGEESMHAAVRRSVGIPHELASRTGPFA